MFVPYLAEQIRYRGMGQSPIIIQYEMDSRLRGNDKEERVDVGACFKHARAVMKT